MTKLTPMLGAPSFECPHCFAYSQQTWYLTYGIEPNDPPKPTDYPALFAYIQQGPRNHINPETLRKAEMRLIEKPHLNTIGITTVDKIIEIVYFAECYSCKEVSMWVNNTLSWPTSTIDVKANQDMPPEVAFDFMEAAKVFNLSPRSSAALLRLALQKLLKHLGQTGKNINSDIADLVKKGLPVTVQRALDLVRVIGNNAVHPGSISIEDNSDVARQLFLLLNIITEQMITQPRLIEDAFGSLPQDVRDNIDKRDGR